jgi:hypothetical protein
MISHLPCCYGDKTQEEGRHGRDEKWLITLARNLERTTLVRKENNKQDLKKEV